MIHLENTHYMFVTISSVNLKCHISFYTPLKDMQGKNKNESSGNIFKIIIVVRTKRKQLSLKIV